MRGFRHQHTSDLSASLTCSTMAFDLDYLEDQVDAATKTKAVTDSSRQTLSNSVKLLLMVLVKGLLSKTNFDAIISMAEKLRRGSGLHFIPLCAWYGFFKIGQNEQAVYHCRRFS